VKDLARITRADVVAHHRRIFRPGAAVLVIVGKVDVEETLALVRRRFAGWRELPGEALPALVAPAPPVPGVLVVDKPDVTQVQVRVASAGFARRSPDYFPGMVASAVLGGGFTSRLMEAIRVNRGLSYGVRSRFATSRAGGVFFVSTFTKVETAAEIVEVTLEETRRFCDAGPGEDELERMKSYLCGLFPMSLETHEQIAEKLTDLELYGLPEEEVTLFREKIRAVGAADCLRVGRAYFPVARPVVVAVGPAKAIARSLEKFGPVKVVPARKVV
jgi:zinc protease